MESGAPPRGILVNEAAELRRALRGEPYFRDGRWGMATLEVCLAMMESGKQRKEIMLQHQVPVPAGYDADMPVPQV